MEEKPDDFQKVLNKLESYGQAFLQSRVWREFVGYLEFVIPRIGDNQHIIGVFLVFAVLISGAVIVKHQGPRLDNKQVGFTVVGPRGWKPEVSPDRMTVTYKKPLKKTLESSVIVFQVTLGNPYGRTPLSYLQQGILPQLRYNYETINNAKFTMREYPGNVEINGRTWATGSFYLNFENLHAIYVTESDEYIFVLMLRAAGTEQSRDEITFKKVLRSVSLATTPLRREIPRYTR
ncbi:MAG: hypothetical protein Q8Q08_05325 [Candidatus Omnitrophota bacterium]|nr:hypothetical protein [Candidatus Omnitrophota bacterium]MDZ4242351.1 hypothetical protein [Candidatus Omnitrophota bacterium]